MSAATFNLHSNPKPKNMTDNTRKVLNGFIELSDEEKQEFINELQKWSNLDFSERRRYNESIQKSVDLGPLSSSCPCCGK